MKKAFFIFVILVLPFIQAIAIEEGVVFNTTESNTSITFDVAINATNVLIESTYIIIEGIDIKNETGTYIFDDVNYSEENSNLNSSDFNLTENSEYEEVGSSGGGSGFDSYYFLEEKGDEEVINLKIKIPKNQEKEIILKDSKNTSIIKIKISSKEKIEGEIKISKINTLPMCKQINENEDVYEIIKIDSTIENEKIENVSLFLEIKKDWIQKNNISEIFGFKCVPEFQKITSDLDSTINGSLLYNFQSDGFSDWVIYGTTKESEREKRDEEKNISTGESSKITGMAIDSYDEDEKIKILKYWPFILVVILIVVMIIFGLLKKKRKTKTQDKSEFKNKFLILDRRYYKP